jgi:hypothetical protein
METVNEIITCPAVKLTNGSKRDKALSAAHNSVQHWPSTVQQSYCFTMSIWIQTSIDNCRRLQKSRPATGFAQPAIRWLPF